MMKTRLGLFAMNTTFVSLLAISTVAMVGCSKPTDATGVQPVSTTVGTEIDDGIVTTTVKAALLADPDVKSLDLKVETRKGEVLLSGFVDNLTQKERAAAVISSVAGVKSVDNKLTLKGAATTVGTKVDDSIVTTRVKTALLADPDIKSLDIAAVTRKGEVQLSGFVDNQRQIDRAVAVTRVTEGVSGVINELRVKK